MFLTVPKPSFVRRAIRLTVMAVASALPMLAAEPAPTDAQARFEVDFLTEMVDHHQAAVEMAELVADRTERAELREFATTLAAAQAKEIETMQGWLEEWYGETHEPELDRKAGRQLAALAELEGDEFEQAFLRAMSLHHAGALVMGKEALLQAWHSELIDLVRGMVAMQADEIALMRGWLMEWHDINEITPRDRPDNRRWNTPGPRRPAVPAPSPAG